MDFVSRSLSSTAQRSYNRGMPVFDEKQEELEHYETMMGVPRGRLAVTMDTITDAMALVGQHGVYCQSQRWPGKPVMDVQMIMKNLTDAKELIPSVMEALRQEEQSFTENRELNDGTQNLLAGLHGPWHSRRCRPAHLVGVDLDHSHRLHLLVDSLSQRMVRMTRAALA